MHIHIAIETLDPLSGIARAERGEVLSFEGWLGLLDTLAKMVGSAGDPERKPGKATPMTFDPTRIQKFSTQDPPTWLKVGDHAAYLG